MNKILLLVNNQVAFDFDKVVTLEKNQLSFLDKMDADMAKGVKINGQSISEPDKNQRATFVVMNLIRALQQENETVVTASCSYIANRLPDIEEVHVNEHESGIKVVFI